MINVSNEFKSIVSGQNRTFYSGAEITLLDSTVLNLDNSNIIGLKIEDAVSQSGVFTIGSAIINKLTLTINNMDDEYSTYDFTGAIIRPTVGLQLSASIETLPKGVFTADDPKAIGSIITLTALDNMAKFDKPFSGVTQIFPCTASTLLMAVCTYCGVVLSTSTFTNSDYPIATRPIDEAINCREIIIGIAQLSGNFARCNTSGQLELKWYDVEIFEQNNLDGGYFDSTQVPFTDIKSGTTIVSSETSEDATAKITQIEGASSQVVTLSPVSPSPDYPSTITTAENFAIIASNGTDSNSINVTQKLGSLPSGVKDTIEAVGGVLNYVKRVGSVVFNGGEAWNLASTYANTLRFTYANALIKIATNVSSDKFKEGIAGANTENIDGHGSSKLIQITILKSRLATLDTVGFKAWLAANLVTVQYELATIIYTPIADLTLSSYKGVTTITSTSTPLVNMTAEIPQTLKWSEKYESGDTADGGDFTFTETTSFDGGNFTDSDRWHHIFALNQFSCATDDVVITGISVTDSAETPNTVLFGSTGYVISLSGNKLIQSLADATTIANSVGAKIVGMKFRPCSLTAISDPSREAGDVAYVTDRKQNTYQILLSSVSFGIGSADKISCDAESPSRNSSTRYDTTTKAIIEARKNTETQLTTYDLLVQQMSDVITHGYGMFQSKEVDGFGATIFYLHDKPIMEESTIRWFTTSEGTIEQVKSLGLWVTVSGVDKQGNALYNVLTARKISADLISTGKIQSPTGDIYIDMALGVANHDNFNATDNVAVNYPLRMPFNIDDGVGAITKVLLKYSIDKFRTYSDGASSGGYSSSTSYNPKVPTSAYTSTSGGSSGTTGLNGVYDGSTESALGPGSHTHDIFMLSHGHPVDYPSHSHSYNTIGHIHDVDIPNHTHNLNFGIMEFEVSDNTITVYVDGTLRATPITAQGIIDLTAWVTTTGWHSIELRSTTLKRISATVNVKSYIRN